MTARFLAEQSGMHFTRVSKLENGVLVPTEQNVRDWCRICGAEGAVDELLSVLRAVDSAYVEWRTRTREGMRRSQGPKSLSLYERTLTFRIHEPLVVPGILQTAAYMKGVLRFWYEFLDAAYDLEETVQFRLDRAAKVLTSKRVAVVLFEEVLSVRYCSTDDHENQLLQLIRLAKLPNVSLGVVPRDIERWGVAAVGFWIFDSASVYLETPTAELKVTRLHEVHQYERLFDLLQGQAVYGRDARRLITKAMDQI